MADNVGEKIDGLVGVSQIGAAARGIILEKISESDKVLEIGTYDGVTVAWLARNRPSAVFVSVDRVQGRGFQHLRNWYENRQPNMMMVVGTSTKFFMVLMPHVKWDMIIIDGDHSYRGVKSDLRLAYENLEDTGEVVCHDYGCGDEKPLLEGVTNAVDEAVAKDMFRITHVVGSTAFLRKVLEGKRGDAWV